jgi:hypothetical protein
MSFVSRTLCGAFLTAASVIWATPASGSAQARKLLDELPISFEANQGQWDAGVKYAGRSGAARLLLTARGAVLSSAAGTAEVSMTGANASARVSGIDPAPARSNYFMGARRYTGVPHYSRVRYEEVYPGIDVVYYGNGKQLEYDFVLRPGADPNRIRLAFRGGRLSMTPEGDLLLETGDARLLQKRPVVYQERAGSRRPVEARYRLTGHGAAAIELAAWDRSRPLTIDPVLVYSSYLGGSLSDGITAVKVGKDGKIYAAGYIDNSDITASPGAWHNESAGLRDIFVARFDQSQSGGNSLASFTYIGGGGNDMPAAMALDASGNVYLTGTTTSTNLPLYGNSAQTSLGGGTGTDAFVIKLSNGFDAILYSTYLGGSDVENGAGIDVDSNGNVYVVGTTRSTNFPLTSGVLQDAKWGVRDGFITKLNPNASPSLVYSSYLGGELADDARAVAVGPDGMVYIVGSTNSTQFPMAGDSLQGALSGPMDGFITKMDLTKSGYDAVRYSTYFGGSDVDVLRAVALDAKGGVVVAGDTLSTDLPVTPGAFQPKAHANGDAMVARLDLSAPRSSALTYSTYLGGGAGDVAYSVTTDPAGLIYVTGYTMSGDFPVAGSPVQATWGGGINVFAAKLDPSKAGSDSLPFSTYMGKTGVEIGYGIAVAKDGSIVVGGQTSSNGIQSTGNAYQKSANGGFSDGFVFVIAP